MQISFSLKFYFLEFLKRIMIAAFTFTYVRVHLVFIYNRTRYSIVIPNDDNNRKRKVKNCYKEKLISLICSIHKDKFLFTVK